MRLGLFFFSALLFPILGNACLWDSDTIAIEAQGRIEVLETALGWYDRFPPLYYEKRLERVTREVAQTPDKLELYDDAGVACDKLGKVDEAIEWMKMKEAAMASLPAEKAKEHRYRYLANLGTFHAHRWVKTPDREHAPADIDLAIRLITEAIKLNPDAHFGREKTQLVLLEWMKNPNRSGYSTLEEAGELRQTRTDFASLLKAHPDLDAVKGLCGIIQIGAGQDSVDLHLLLADTLAYENPTLAHVISLRIADLLFNESRKPMIRQFDWLHTLSVRDPADADSNTSISKAVVQLRYKALGGSQSTQNLDVVSAWFFKSRAAAIQRRSDKDIYILDRLNEGKHPDTHPDFWAGWKEPAFPALPAQTSMESLVGTKIAAVVDPSINHSAKFVYLFLALLTVYLSLRTLSLLMKRRSEKPSQT